MYKRHLKGTYVRVLFKYTFHLRSFSSFLNKNVLTLVKRMSVEYILIEEKEPNYCRLNVVVTFDKNGKEYKWENLPRLILKDMDGKKHIMITIFGIEMMILLIGNQDGGDMNVRYEEKFAPMNGEYNYLKAVGISFNLIGGFLPPPDTHPFKLGRFYSTWFVFKDDLIPKKLNPFESFKDFKHEIKCDRS